MSASVRRKPKPRSKVESLESRRLLVAFGTPWPDARDLTISFPDDQVDVGAYENDIQSTLDQIATRQEWQELSLRAYQTWAIHADINVGLRNDHNVAFGSPGFMVGDPRFGEFRIGAFPQQGILANSVPFQAIAGTYSGDLLLNSNEQFTFHDWADDTGPDPSTIGENERDLFSLLLHETGNTLGISDSADEWTVMFQQYTSPKGVLTQDDIGRLQDLYGARTDPYEQADNGQLQSATLLTTPIDFDSSADVLRTRGSLASGSDVDYFKVISGAGVDTATIQVKASGISLLQSKLELVDASGAVLDDSTSVSVFDNDNTLQLNGLLNQSEVYIRVSAADSDDIYAVGDYELIVDYRDQAVRSTDLIESAYDAGPDTLFSNYGLADSEADENDTFVNPEIVASTSGNPNRYELFSSVSSADDIDFFKFAAPAEIDGRLVVNVSGVGLDQPELKVRILDSDGKGVSTAGVLRSDGTWMLEVAEPQPGAEYVLRISVDPSSAVGVGNYIAVAEFVQASSQMNEMAAGTLSDSTDTFVQWTATETKLLRFDLGSVGATSAQGVQLTIYDAHTRELKAVVTSTGDVTRTTLAWIQQGDYILRFSTVSTDGSAVENVSYALAVEGVSDDQGDGDDSDDDDDNYYYYDYYYSDTYGDYDYEWYEDPASEYYDDYEYEPFNDDDYDYDSDYGDYGP